MLADTASCRRAEEDFQCREAECRKLEKNCGEVRLDYQPLFGETNQRSFPDLEAGSPASEIAQKSNLWEDQLIFCLFLSFKSLVNVLNNKNTNNVETHSDILLLVYLGLSIVRCWEAIQHMRYLREYSNQNDKNI